MIHFRYEYCYWKNNGRNCDFEWKRKAWNITKTSCIGLNSRVNFIGNYDDHECKIEITNISSDDNGTWTCEMEAYVFGENSGGKTEKNIELVVT